MSNKSTTFRWVACSNNLNNQEICYSSRNIIRYGQTKKDCAYLWTLFYNAFANKEPCGLPDDAYDAFIAYANHSLDTDGKVSNHFDPFT